MATPAYEPVFRQVDGPSWRPGVMWQAELHEPSKWGPDESLPYPVAMAWISDDPDETRSNGPKLWYVLVPDGLRRRGLGRRLVEACRGRWPGLRLSEAISDEGAALLDALEAC